jgi:hypothetical protein
MSEFKEIPTTKYFDGKSYRLYSVAINKTDVETVKERLIQAYKMAYQHTPSIRVIPHPRSSGYAIYVRRS